MGFPPEGFIAWTLWIVTSATTLDRLYASFRKRFMPHLPAAPLGLLGRMTGRIASYETLLAVRTLSNQSLKVQLTAERTKTEALEALLELAESKGFSYVLPDVTSTNFTGRSSTQSEAESRPSTTNSIGGKQAT